MGLALRWNEFSTWFELRWKHRQPWKPWTKYFESYIFLQPPMTIDRLVIFVAFKFQHMRGHYLWLRHCDAAWHGMCQVPGDRLDSKPTFVLFHNDTRYTGKFKFGIGIAVMVSTNISYQPQLFVKHSNSKSINMISTGTRHGGTKSGVPKHRDISI